jgi:hypothetical protein
MFAGMSTYTVVHVVISLIGIASGLIVAFGLVGAKRMDGMTAIFLATTLLTDITGFFFPFTVFKPSYVVGTLSTIVLLIAIFARYSKHLAAGWRRAYVITAMIGLYLNCFVLVAQLFMKVPSLNKLAPNGNEPPFLISQVVAMVIFIIWTVIAVKQFRPDSLRTA